MRKDQRLQANKSDLEIETTCRKRITVKEAYQSVIIFQIIFLRQEKNLLHKNQKKITWPYTTLRHKVKLRGIDKSYRRMNRCVKICTKWSNYDNLGEKSKRFSVTSTTERAY